MGIFLLLGFPVSLAVLSGCGAGGGTGDERAADRDTSETGDSGAPDTGDSGASDTGDSANSEGSIVFGDADGATPRLRSLDLATGIVTDLAVGYNPYVNRAGQIVYLNDCDLTLTEPSCESVWLLESPAAAPSLLLTSSNGFRSVAISDDGMYVAAFEDRSTSIFDRDGEVIASAGSYFPLWPAWSAAGTLVSSTTAVDGDPVRLILSPPPGYFDSSTFIDTPFEEAYSPWFAADGRTIWFSHDFAIYALDLASGAIVNEVTIREEVFSVAYSPSEAEFVAADGATYGNLYRGDWSGVQQEPLRDSTGRAITVDEDTRINWR